VGTISAKTKGRRRVEDSGRGEKALRRERKGAGRREEETRGEET